MDEPLYNLDAQLRVHTRGELKRLQAELGVTTIYVTHDQAEAMTLADRVAIMRDGLLQQVGPPREIYDRPVNMFVGGFLGSPGMNFLRGTLQSSDGQLGWSCGGDTLWLPSGVGGAAVSGGWPRVGGARRPVGGRRRWQTQTGRVSLPAEVFVAEALGNETLVRLQLDGQELVARAAPTTRPRSANTSASARTCRAPTCSTRATQQRII